MSRFLSRGVTLCAILEMMNLLLMAAIANDGSVGNSTTEAPASQTPSLIIPPFASLIKTNRTFEDFKQSKDQTMMSTERSSGTLVSSQSYDGLSLNTGLFVTENLTILTTQLKSNALLSCVVRAAGDGVTVSWIRRKEKDYHLLTVGLQTYSSDDRFQAIHAQSPDDWTLKIKYVQARDAGQYECQVSTHPPSSIFLTLKVVEAKAEIAGGPDKYIKSGSTLRLICELKQSTEEPTHVFWYQGLRMINYDPSRNIEVTHERYSMLENGGKGDIPAMRYSSTLVLHNVERTDSGNYSCAPSNASPANIFVHIINGENPAAMQHGSHSTTCVPCPPLWFISIILSITLQHLYVRFLNNYQYSSYPLLPFTSERESS